MKFMRIVQVLAASCFASALLAQSVPPLINYQGRLTDAAGAPLPDGAYRVAFKVWNDSLDSSTNAPTHLVWGHEHDVMLNGGAFNVILGAGGGTLVPGAAVNDPSFAFGESNRFLGLTIIQTPTATITANQQREILPRQQLLSVPFAVQAQQAQIASSLITNLANALCPPGSIMAYMGTNPPPGWLLCDGTSVSRSQYAALFTVVGTSSGSGNGSTTFNLPDLRGLFLRGVTGMRTNLFGDPDAASRTNSVNGGRTGNAVGSLQLDDFMSHTHTQSAGDIAWLGAGGRGGRYADGSITAHPFETLATGGNETRPKNAYANYLIKY